MILHSKIYFRDVEYINDSGYYQLKQIILNHPTLINLYIAFSFRNLLDWSYINCRVLNRLSNLKNMLFRRLIIWIRVCRMYNSNMQIQNFFLRLSFISLIKVFIKMYHLTISVWSKEYTSKNYFSIGNNGILLMIHKILAVNKLQSWIQSSITYTFV